MASGIEISIEMPELEEIKAAFRSLPPNIAAKHLAAGLGRAIDPAVGVLKSLTPKGPTGNLRRSIKKKTKKYSAGPNSRNPAKSPGSGVAMVGYVAPPKGRAAQNNTEKGYHGGFLEFGTKDRKTKGRIASSFASAGKIKVAFSKRAGKFRTTPKPPKGFVKAVPKGDVVDLGRFPIGGKGGLPPIKTTFERTKAGIKSNMNTELTKSLNNALKEMASPFRAKGNR